MNSFGIKFQDSKIVNSVNGYIEEEQEVGYEPDIKKLLDFKPEKKENKSFIMGNNNYKSRNDEMKLETTLTNNITNANYYRMTERKN